MSADLHIHVLCGEATAGDVARLKAPTLAGDPRWDAAFDRITDTPSCWIGEVSWLKASLTGDSATYVPSAVETIQTIIGSGVVTLTEPMIDTMLAAFTQDNTTDYRVTSRAKVESFLRAHVGASIFTVSW